MFLLDVNVLLALGDPFHVHHESVLEWFFRHHREGWATSPLTENGFLRILGHPQYHQGPGSPTAARRLLEKLIAHPGHQFWADSISLCDSKQYPVLPSSKHLTDYFLLALAIKHHAKLATLDQRVDPALLPRGPAAYYVVKDEG